MHRPVQIVDLFSGPGGLGEGFASLKGPAGRPAFQVRVSVEKEPSAHRTLRLRAFLRQFDVWPKQYYDWLAKGGSEPDWGARFPTQWAAAEDEARCMELGNPETARFLTARIAAIKSESGGHTVLIGGPPCQAYSLVGRSRNAGNAAYDPANDQRNFLYDEYVRVLHQLMPAVFVMENVKGMLSAAVKGDAIFHAVLRDLRAEGYLLVGLAPRSGSDTTLSPTPQDFIVRSEAFGIPQARHRVIIVGIRNDLAEKLAPDDFPSLKPAHEPVTVGEALAGMPRLRSGLSRGDDARAWVDAVRDAALHVERTIRSLDPEIVRRLVGPVRAARREAPALAAASRIGPIPTSGGDRMPRPLRRWIRDDRLSALPQNETRAHMPADLARYLFVSAWGAAFGTSPKAEEFPEGLAPDHANWHSGKFADRFRVQLVDRPATTVTSHIAKDGHYYIHPDPSQCRSLTVREAARLQTFPDNYVFLGNRTQQFVQVGNAVPPLLARQIAEAIVPSLTKEGMF